MQACGRFGSPVRQVGCGGLIPWVQVLGDEMGEEEKNNTWWGLDGLALDHDAWMVAGAKAARRFLAGGLNLCDG